MSNDTLLCVHYVQPRFSKKIGYSPPLDMMFFLIIIIIIIIIITTTIIIIIIIIIMIIIIVYIYSAISDHYPIALYNDFKISRQ